MVKLQFSDKIKMCHKIPLYMKQCGVTEMPQPTNHIPGGKEHACLVQAPAKITFLYFFSRNEMQKLAISVKIITI